MARTELMHRDYLFALWMARQPMEGALVTPEIVAQQFEVSRATSYRWLRAYRFALRKIHSDLAA